MLYISCIKKNKNKYDKSSVCAYLLPNTWRENITWKSSLFFGQRNKQKEPKKARPFHRQEEPIIH